MLLGGAEETDAGDELSGGWAWVCDGEVAGACAVLSAWRLWRNVVEFAASVATGSGGVLPELNNV